ncbi:MAG: spermidine/putrescine ABC transporter substrate-binding protein [Verrucomicrobiales bacterium]|jgi:spermidine/putrescine transport system substrate-binding protein|nr:spermidine/putrescine ABC transporter substrate-binding protein [Verrucomicrobiales bacterium]
MKNILTILLALTVSFIISGCGKTKNKLYIYTWAEYIEPSLVAEFERQHDCEVVIDTFDSNESMHAKVKAGGGGYDLISPSSYMVEILVKENLIDPLDHGFLPNLKNIDPEYLAKFALDPRMEYSVPYMLSSTGIGYSKSKVTDFKPTWHMFENEQYAKRSMLFNDMREVLGAALKTLGYSLNTTDPQEIEQAKELVLKWKKNLAKFDSEAYKPGLASGESLLAQGYSGDVLQLTADHEDIGYAIPEEGTSFACDDWVIPRDARHKDLAYAFINFIHDPANAAKNMEFVNYWCPNVPAYALLPEDLRGDELLFPPKEVLEKCEIIRDLGDQNTLYIKAWDEIKARE